MISKPGGGSESIFECEEGKDEKRESFRWLSLQSVDVRYGIQENDDAGRIRKGGKEGCRARECVWFMGYAILW